MISREKSKLRKNLLTIEQELDKYKDKELLEVGVDIKLNRTSRKYKENIDKNIDYILSRNNYKVLRAIDRYEKKKGKVINE